MTSHPSDLAARVRDGIAAMPCNRLLGIRVTAMADGEARAVLPAREELGNHVGTVHTAAQYALAEATAGAAVGSAFLDLLGGAVPLALGAEVAYLRAATGELAASAALGPEVSERVREALAAQGQARFAVAVRVTDSAGETAMEAQTRWVLRRTGGD